MSFELRLGGIALLASVGVLGVVFALVVSRSQIRGLSAGFMGVEGIGRDAVALRTLMRGLALFGILQLIGFGVLAASLTEVGERTIATVSYALWVLASAAGVFRVVSDGTITVWAGERWAETGSVPEVYAPLNDLAQNSFVWFAEVPWLIAAAGFGWAVLRSGLLPSWVGYIAIGWSAVWLSYPVIFKSDLPAVLMIYPILFGVGMLIAEG
ncbi:MAG: hypothetical protein R3258_10890 [Acidimicrobiia bacterium]|nr:hypothetical protein [Acidimicrobiia bacterium]